MPVPVADVEELGINVIRGFAMDAPQRANSGHPGTAMALAPLAHVLWTRIMKYDPTDPALARPRSVHPLGRTRVDPPLLDALPHRLRARSSTISKQFRQWGSKTPGHPENLDTPWRRGHHRPARPGLRATASGWASPSATCGPGSAPTIVDHHTFVIASDGDLEEGISHEAASLAGHLQLGRLVVRLRRQPHHDRRPDRALLQRRRGQALRGVRLARRARRRGRQRRRRARGSRAASDGRGRPALAHHPAQPHRLAVTEQDRHCRGARQPARRRGDRAHEGAARPARTRTSTCPPEVLDWYRGVGPAAATAPRRVGRSGSPSGRATAPTSTRRSRADGVTGWAGQAPELQRRREARDPPGAVDAR